MTSLLSPRRSINLETPIGLTKIISCISFNLLVDKYINNFNAGHLTLNSNSSKSVNTNPTLSVFLINISVNCSPILLLGPCLSTENT